MWQFWRRNAHLNDDTFTQSGERVHLLDLCMAVTEIELHDALMDVMLTHHTLLLFRAPMHKGGVLTVEPVKDCTKAKKTNMKHCSKHKNCQSLKCLIEVE